MRSGTSSSQPQPLVMPADGLDAKLYESAVSRAIELVNADGGTIATLDEFRRMMVLRVRQVHPRLQPPPRHSTSRPIQQPPAQSHPIEEASTTVLPATQLWRHFKSGERLIGYVWQIGEPIIMSGDEVRGLPSGSSPEDPDAAWHMAVPIFAASPDDQPTIEEPPIIGVLAVYAIDPQWRFSQNHLRLLQLQAQTIAQSIVLSQVNREEQRHRRLLTLLQELTGDVPTMADLDTFYETFFDRVRVAISGVVSVDAFAVAIPQPGLSDTTLTLYAVSELGERYTPQALSEGQAPWWSKMRLGRAEGWVTDDDRRANPSFRPREWGGNHYMDSQLFVPIRTPVGVIGALMVASRRMNAYTPDQVALLETAGRFIGLAIEHAQMRQSQRTNSAQSGMSERALSVLNNALLGLNATLDVAQIVRDLVEQASELSRGQVAVYFEYSPQVDELIVRDIAQNKEHRHEEIIGQRIPVGKDRRRRAVDGEILALEDLTAEYKRGDIVGSLLSRYQVEAMLVVPVIYTESVTRRDRVLGLLAIYAPGQRGLFAPAEAMNLSALGHVAAAALNNARTYAQLRELDRLKDEFILTASHEFRTPMSAIQGFSWLIQRRGDTMTAEQGKHWASEIIRATEQLKDMMDTVTESWRTQSVQMPPLQPVDVAEVVRLAQEISSGPISAENHVVEARVPENVYVVSEQDRLRHVVSNLLVNAAKYSDGGSTISVTMAVKSGTELLAIPRERGARDSEDEDDEPVQNVIPQSGPWVVISVHDHGIGINAANQKRLFAKFVRLELTTSVRGTGLGLYICRRYIEAMGGEIWVESAPGQGSTFSFCLPQTSAPPNAEAGS